MSTSTWVDEDEDAVVYDLIDVDFMAAIDALDAVMSRRGSDALPIRAALRRGLLDYEDIDQGITDGIERFSGGAHGRHGGCRERRKAFFHCPHPVEERNGAIVPISKERRR